MHQEGLSDGPYKMLARGLII